MDIDAAKSAFNNGLFIAAEIRPLDQDSYILVLLDKSRDEVPLSFWRQTQIKRYKKVTGAIGDATRIGFEKVVLNLAVNEDEPHQEQLRFMG